MLAHELKAETRLAEALGLLDEVSLVLMRVNGSHPDLIVGGERLGGDFSQIALEALHRAAAAHLRLDQLERQRLLHRSSEGCATIGSSSRWRDDWKSPVSALGSSSGQSQDRATRQTAGLPDFHDSIAFSSGATQWVIGTLPHSVSRQLGFVSYTQGISALSIHSVRSGRNSACGSL